MDIIIFEEERKKFLALSAKFEEMVRLEKEAFHEEH
ncbi:hypothetical protein JOD43_004327 [Pullulanibacillus pueri]|nr:hypothetical protein [Pullulanibacillus pueri]